ncbi:hypothetical protein GH733_009377 [Mirounga leonina]|nr:hypothetical protein GH733_009377 [Mirounga leonina]
MDNLSSEEIQLRAHQVTEESLKRVKTITMLDEQREPLNCIEEGLDHINKDMREAEKTLTELSKCCGLCVCPCNRTKNFESGKAYKATWGGGGDNSPPNVVSKQPGPVTNGQPQQPASGTANWITEKADTDKDRIDVANVKAKKLIDS